MAGAANDSDVNESEASADRRTVLPLLLVFGTLYLVQGIVEPTACLPFQPIQTQLETWRFTTEQIGHFFGIVGIAWSLKPLFGLVSDFLPLAGRRRRPYLVISTAMAAAAFLVLSAVWRPAAGKAGGSFGWLIGAGSE